MYRVSVQADFIAQHYLIGDDFGPENDKHSHHYVVEFEVAGNTLDENSSLIDLIDLEENLDQRVSYFQDQTLNQLSEFKGLNPTLENFARIICEELDKEMIADNVTWVSVKLWQDEATWASYEMER